MCACTPLLRLDTVTPLTAEPQRCVSCALCTQVRGRFPAISNAGGHISGLKVLCRSIGFQCALSLRPAELSRKQRHFQAQTSISI